MQNIDYKIIYSRRRSIGISVGPESGVIVRAPYRTSIKTINNLVLAKSNWIKKHLEGFKKATQINSNNSFANGENAFFRGKVYHIRIIESTDYFVRLVESNIEIGLIDPRDNTKAASMLKKWYREVAEEFFRRKFEEIIIHYKKYNFLPNELLIRSLKRRWGSCTSKGKITLSSELIKLDEIYLEYVILHELCHLNHHNHGKEFYKLLTEVYPQWKQRRNELKKYIR